MAFNPALPAEGSPLDSGVMRAQFIALNEDTQTRVTNAALNAAITTTSSNSNAVNLLNQAAYASYEPTQMQDVMNKIDELINTLRR